jgi:uncharacterized protein YjbJ (UPF0337 family)
VTVVSSLDQIPGLWKRQLGAAKIASAKRTEDELLKLDGHEQKLVGLIQERYALTRAEASLQARHCFDTWEA